jgi:hypothetical protein
MFKQQYLKMCQNEYFVAVSIFISYNCEAMQSYVKAKRHASLKAFLLLDFKINKNVNVENYIYVSFLI